MMNRQYLFLMLFVATTFVHCFTHKKTIIDMPKDLTINLRWIQAHSKESKAQAMTGLKWAFSYLGALLPKGSLEEAIEWQGNTTTFKVDLGKLGFSSDAEQAWNKILRVLRRSDEYQEMGGIDLGRFIILTLNSSHHYYAITGVEEKFSDFEKKYLFQQKSFAMRQYESCVAKESRIVQFSDLEGLPNLGFIALEGKGNLEEQGTFSPTEYEVMDFMPNGQFRFAIYDIKSGALKTASDTALTLAGKPAKCLWCHEAGINQPFNAITAVEGYVTPQFFSDFVQNGRVKVDSFRSLLETDLVFKQLRPEHTYMELQYISFMEPSVRRLALEWNMEVGETQALVKDFSTHRHHEFNYLGDLYHRKEVDKIAPYRSVRVPDSGREWSAYEPNFVDF